MGGSGDVHGLVINRFVNGVVLAIQGSTIVECNFIGTDVTGTSALPNEENGILIHQASSGNLIGEPLGGLRNVISGNGVNGILILDPGTTGNVVRANLIGVDVTGTVVLANGDDGIGISNAAGNTIGGTAPGAGNVIGGSDEAVRLGSALTTGNVLQGNFIGTDPTGLLDLGNVIGVSFEFGPSGNTVGGTAAGAGNVIAFNLVGVAMDDGTGNSILSNAIYSNDQQGIDLGFNGVPAANDPDDVDAGANNGQNYPVLTSAVSTAGMTTIQGTLDSTASRAFRIELFANAACDPSGFGEGQTFLASTTVATDGGGDAAFLVMVPDPAGAFITATATDDTTGDTSEFSACEGIVVITPTPTTTGTSTPTQTPTSTPTQTPTSTPTQTPTSTATGTATSTPTMTATGTATSTPTSTATGTATSAATSTATATPTLTATSTPLRAESVPEIPMLSGSAAALLALLLAGVAAIYLVRTRG